MRATTRLTALAITIAALAACNGDTTAPPTDGTPAGGTETAAADDTGTGTETGAAATGTSEVEIDDFDYSPTEISVAAGTEVTWTNVDPALHSVTAGTPDAPEPDVFDLDDIDEAGQTVSHTFEEPGTYAYFCRYHDFMTGTVEVTG